MRRQFRYIYQSSFIYLCLALLLFVGLISSIPAHADTNVSGHITADTTWTLANSPYIVTGFVTVDAGATLTIEPGVTVKLNAGMYITVNGTLIARGTPASQITFTKNTPSNWGYIKFNDSSADATFDASTGAYTGGSILEYCVIEYSTEGIKTDYANPFINFCTLRNNKAGIRGTNLSGLTKITNNMFRDNDCGQYPGITAIYLSYIYYCPQASSAIVKGNTLINNNVKYGNWGADLIAIDGANCAAADLSDNILFNNRGTGIYISSGSTNATSVHNNIISGNDGKSITAHAGVHANNALINNSDTVLYAPGSTNPIFEKNTITKNRSSNPIISVEYTSNATVRYNNIFENDAPYALEINQAQNVNAKYNWWGTTSDGDIQAMIYDYFDTLNSQTGVADYQPFETVMRTDTPISPVTGLRVESGVLKWDANPEADVAGYKVYYGTSPGFPYASVIDAGNVTSYAFSGLTGGVFVSVTAYDRDYNAANDDPATPVNENQTGGHESWFCPEVIYTPVITIPDKRGGMYNGPLQVTLSTNVAATIHYTTDGSAPGMDSAVYTSPIPITTTSTLRYFAVDGRGNREDVHAEIYTIIPVGVFAIAAGGVHSLALKSDGTIWTWGNNWYGQLGDGTTWNAKTLPKQIGTDKSWSAIAAGNSQSLALKVDGTLWSWGLNDYGELGLGDNTDRSTPTQVAGTGWLAVSTGRDHVLTMKADRSLWSWGHNDSGQLGLGDQTNRNIPTQVAGDGWAAISAGKYHSLALKTDGTLWAWGWNGYGQLGDGTTTDKLSPTQIGTDHDWVAVAAGDYHSLALKADGTLWSWGYNYYGELGLGDKVDRYSPTKMAGSGWKTVAARGPYSFALKADGSLWSWGHNDSGQLGLGDNTDRNTPTQVAGSSWAAISAGSSHSLALKIDGTLWSWGDNGNGQLGDGTYTNRTSPVQVTIPHTISIDGGAAATNSVNATLAFSLSSSDVVSMAFSNDGTNYTAWENYAPSKAWTLPGGDGPKTVYVKFKTAGGAESVFTTTIALDTVAPQPVITLPVNNATVTSLFSIEGTASDASPSSGLKKLELKVTDGTYYLKQDGTWTTTETWIVPNGGTLASWILDTNAVQWTGGNNYITARATDNGGNTASTSITVTYSRPQAYTTLAIDLSSQTILMNGKLSVAGKLTRPGDDTVNLSNLPVKLTITPPSGSPTVLPGYTTDASGHFAFSDIDVFSQRGTYTLQASFDGNSSLARGVSTVHAVLVGASAGYAVIVQGKISSGEGLPSHNKTLNRIYKKLRERGFDALNIRYFNYDTAQPDVYASPTKAAVGTAITEWARDRMNSSPAPLYVILVDHGNSGIFWLGTEEITPGDLSGWLNSLEGSLTQAALAEKRIIIIGSCYSGSFIPALSKPGANRIIITSAAADEESYKGANENDNIRSGEYFLEEFFIQLGRGYSFGKSFEEAAGKTRDFTRRGGSSVNTVNRYFDNAVQHPLLDENGDGKGSNILSVIPGQGDGPVAGTLFLGTGVTYTNSATNPAEVLEVTESIYLGQLESSATFWLTANNNSEVLSAWVEVRPPSKTLVGTGGSKQLELDIPRQFLDPVSGRWEKQYSSFTEPGKYEVLYFVRDVDTGAVSPMKRSVVYKDTAGNRPPSPFPLLSPENNSERKTVLVFKWQSTTDPDSDLVTYNLIIAKDSGFTNIVYRKEELIAPLAYVDSTAGIKDLTTYYWKIEAVDAYGARTSGTEVWSFHTDNSNGFPGVITGIVYSDRDYARIAGAMVTATIGATTVSTITAPDGSYALAANGGTATIQSTSGSYTGVPTGDVSVKAGETTGLNIVMTLAAIKKGDVDGSGTVDLADAILALQVISKVPLPPFVSIQKDADMNGDGNIGLAEVIYILQRIAELRQN